MKKYIYSQHDEVANFFNHPMVSEVEPFAFAANITRSIKLCKDPSNIAMVENCKLMLLGSWDDETGKFEILEKPQMLVECDKLIESIRGNDGEKN